MYATRFPYENMSAFQLTNSDFGIGTRSERGFKGATNRNVTCNFSVDGPGIAIPGATLDECSWNMQKAREYALSSTPDLENDSDSKHEALEITESPKEIAHSKQSPMNKKLTMNWRWGIVIVEVSEHSRRRPSQDPCSLQTQNSPRVHVEGSCASASTTESLAFLTQHSDRSAALHPGIQPDPSYKNPGHESSSPAEIHFFNWEDTQDMPDNVGVSRTLGKWAGLGLTLNALDPFGRCHAVRKMGVKYTTITRDEGEMYEVGHEYGSDGYVSSIGMHDTSERLAKRVEFGGRKA